MKKTEQVEGKNDWAVVLALALVAIAMIAGDVYLIAHGDGAWVVVQIVLLACIFF